MVRFGDVLDRVIDEFSWLAGYVKEGFESLPTSLQREVAATITGLIDNAMRPLLLQYIDQPVHLKDGTTVQGQSAFDRMVAEDKDVLALIEKYRPSYLFYLEKAKKLRQYIQWDNRRFATNLAAFLQEHGIDVGAEGYGYLERTVERFRRRIYS
jgi:hypothetical protein